MRSRTVPRASKATDTRCDAEAPASPAASSSLAMARVSASRSATPGSCASARSATSSATASRTENRSGRTMASAFCRWIAPPSPMCASIRSSGSPPGSPHIHRVSRSLRSCFSVTPNSTATSGRRAPSCSSR